MKVLAVDDNPMAGLLLNDALGDLGHEAMIAKDAADALALFDREAPDVCVLDWMMPGMDGLELACTLRKRARGPGLYIIMLTAKQDPESVSLAYELGVDEVITKPVPAGVINARLRAAARLVELRDGYADKCKEIAALTAELSRARSAA